MYEGLFSNMIQGLLKFLEFEKNSHGNVLRKPLWDFLKPWLIIRLLQLKPFTDSMMMISMRTFSIYFRILARNSVDQRSHWNVSTILNIIINLNEMMNSFFEVLFICQRLFNIINGEKITINEKPILNRILNRFYLSKHFLVFL